MVCCCIEGGECCFFCRLVMLEKMLSQYYINCLRYDYFFRILSTMFCMWILATLKFLLLYFELCRLDMQSSHSFVYVVGGISIWWSAIVKHLPILLIERKAAQSNASICNIDNSLGQNYFYCRYSQPFKSDCLDLLRTSHHLFSCIFLVLINPICFNYLIFGI